MRLIPTILSGGAGSRLWPVSRELHPKPFIRLADGQSLLQKAFVRGACLRETAGMLAVTNREFYFKTRDEFDEVNESRLPVSFLLEPFGRGTAAAIAAAAHQVREVHGGGAIMLVLPADHLIADDRAFAEAVSRAAQLAEAGRLVTFGIRPDQAHTGYGYIEASGNDVLRFVEKPSAEAAKSYLDSGRFLWNSGMFCFAAGALVEQLQRHCPDIAESVAHCHAVSPAPADARMPRELDPAAFGKVRVDSIDYAVMEKSGDVAVVPCDIGWSDIGSWTALGDLAPSDGQGNRLEGSAVLHDVSGCYIRSADRIVGAVGVRDLLIIDTPDALLVADRSRAQDVKHVFTELKARGHEAHRLHRMVHRPWGAYTVIEEGPGFKIKRIEVKPGASLSLQSHRHRSEHWIVVSGLATVVNGDSEMQVAENESTFIPAGNRHRLSNQDERPLVIIEVQSGSYLGEDDIVRFDDRYGRAKPQDGAPAADPVPAG
jgi:mannose-1-phosphate guanylyltransferase / mannose-6-phosphate isomerase